MAAAKAQTIAPEVFDAINKWLAEADVYASPTSFQFRQILRSVEMLAKADAYAASCAQAMLHHTTGSLDEALHWVRNMRKFPKDSVGSYDTEAIVLSNLGYFERSVQVMEQLPAQPGLKESILLLGGAFEVLIARAEGTELAHTDEGRSALETAARSAMVLKQNNIPEAKLKAILEVAGEVLRAHRMMYADETPIIRTTADHLLYQLRLRVDAGAAAAMTDEVVVKMVERDLDDAGLAFSFIPV